MSPWNTYTHTQNPTKTRFCWKNKVQTPHIFFFLSKDRIWFDQKPYTPLIGNTLIRYNELPVLFFFSWRTYIPLKEKWKCCLLTSSESQSCPVVTPFCWRKEDAKVEVDPGSLEKGGTFWKLSQQPRTTPSEDEERAATWMMVTACGSTGCQLPSPASSLFSYPHWGNVHLLGLFGTPPPALHWTSLGRQLQCVYLKDKKTA